MFEFDYEFDAKTMLVAKDFMLTKYLLASKIILPIIIALSFISEYIKTREIKSLICLIIFLLFCYLIVK